MLGSHSGSSWHDAALWHRVKHVHSGALAGSLVQPRFRVIKGSAWWWYMGSVAACTAVPDMNGFPAAAQLSLLQAAP
jgi:hypothetical protein